VIPHLTSAGGQDGSRQRTNVELREEARRRMLGAAIRLIAQRGASKLSLVDVGLSSGYSHSLPNYYFKTKARLLLEVCRYISDAARERAKAWISDHWTTPIQPGMESIESTIRTYLALATDDAGLTRAMNVLWSESASSMPVLLEAVRPLNHRYLARLERHIRLGVQRGEVDPSVDAPSMAVLILALLRGVASQHLLEPTGVDLERVTQTAVQLIRRGLAAPAANAASAESVPAAASRPNRNTP
jgi:AcrR family transcriptional regulator